MRLFEGTYLRGQSVSLAARRHGLNANQLDTSKNRSDGSFWKGGLGVWEHSGSGVSYIASPIRAGSPRS